MAKKMKAMGKVTVPQLRRSMACILGNQRRGTAIRLNSTNGRAIMIGICALSKAIVAMTMSIPSAIFTESFLGFIGLGVSAPQASLGTLCNAALSGLLTYPYQLMFPAATIAVMMLAFNFLGDGLRDALDPRLRKG